MEFMFFFPIPAPDQWKYRNGWNSSNKYLPNPVSNSAIISFTLSQSEQISLKVFDVNGRLVTTLADGVFEVGEHQIEFNADEVNAGVYFLRIETDKLARTEKLIVTK